MSKAKLDKGRLEIRNRCCLLRERTGMRHQFRVWLHFGLYAGRVVHDFTRVESVEGLVGNKICSSLYRFHYYTGDALECAISSHKRTKASILLDNQVSNAEHIEN
jgi:hypothetical protein